MKIFFQILFIFSGFCVKSQIPDSILFYWKTFENSGSELPCKFINLKNNYFDNTKPSNNTILFQNIIKNCPTDSHTVITFEEGLYMFSSTIFLNSNITIEGNGADKTKFLFENKGSGNLFEINCIQKEKFYTINTNLKAKTNSFYCDSSLFKVGEYYEILIDGKGLATSDWAMQSIGQIVKIKSIENKTVFIYGDFKHDYLAKNNVRFRRIKPIENVNIKYLYIERKDKTTEQTNNFNFNYAVNCTVKGVESKNCNMSHIGFSKSYNCIVRDSYIHHAFSYDGGGKAYGVELSNTTSWCFVENNIYENLRHSILLQSGANGNVITGNYSKNPYWEEVLLPSNSAGEIVLHGNYTFANLIEQNQVGNIVVDNSHGINGPNNVFFRNRASLWGVFMNSGCGNQTHFIANEITGTLSSFSGKGNVTIFNYNKIGDSLDLNKIKLPKSLTYTTKPEWWQQMIDFPLLGTPKQGKFENITSFYRNNFDSLRALNSSPDFFILKSDFSSKIDYKNEVIFKFESNLQVNVCKLVLQACSDISNEWKEISPNIANNYLFQNYKYTDTLKLAGQTCYRWHAEGLNGNFWDSDTVCYNPNATNINFGDTEKIKIYPNPFCEKIEILTTQKNKLKLIDINGKTMLLSIVLPETVNEIQTENLTKGIYFIILENDNKPLIKMILKR